MILLALKGDIAEFKALSAVVKKDKKIHKKRYIETIGKFETLFDRMADGSAECAIDMTAEKSYLDRTVYLICNRDRLSSSEIVSNALILYHAPCNLYKSIAALFLADAYTDQDDGYADLYSTKAKEYAPSKDIYKMCQKHINKRQPREIRT